jgi:hypothetical protein
MGRHDQQVELPMPRIQIPLLGLLLGVAVAGLGFAAIRSGADYWASAFSLGTLVLLLVSVLSARYGRRTAKPFWFGFALFGWASYLLALGHPLVPVNSIVGGTDSRANTLITQVILALVPHLRVKADNFGRMDHQTINAFKIAHLLITLVFAVAGGIVAILIRDRRNRSDGTKSRPARRIGLIILLFFLLGTVSAPAVALALRSQPQYFPETTADVPAPLDEFEVKWYSKHLAAMQEPSLWRLGTSDPAGTAYRFLELPSFAHPIGIRVAKTDAGATLRLVVLDGLGGYLPGGIGIERTVAINPERWNELERLIAKCNFWEMDTEEQIPDGEAIVRHDGTRYIVEGIMDGRYHVVNRDEEEAYGQLREFLHDLTGISLRDPREWRSRR